MPLIKLIMFQITVKKILIAMLALLPLTLSAQQADTQVAQLVNGRQWIELAKAYPQLRDSIKNPAMRSIAEAMIGYEFNDSPTAFNALSDLIQNRQKEIGLQSTCRFAILLGKMLKERGMYAEAAKMTGSLSDNLKSLPQTDIFKEIINLNRYLQAIKNLPPLAIERPESDVELQSDERWALPVSIHGKSCKFVLRQSAENTVITRELASELGLTVLPAVIQRSGSKIQLAVIDSLEIGQLKVRNLIAEIPVDSTAEPTLGIDFMHAVGETRLDLDIRTVCFPKYFTPMPETGHNITWDSPVNINSGYHFIAVNYNDVFLKELRPENASSSLTGSDHALKGATVKAARRLVKSDMGKLSYDIQHDKESKAKSLFEMLRKVPLVTIDGEDNVLVKGSSSYRIYRNGHPDPMLTGSTAKNVLKSIPASSVSKVEVITEPGAKYDAEGTTAIINIVMRDNSQQYGATGTLSSTVNSRGSSQSSAYLAAHVGKLILSGTYSYSHYVPAEQRISSRSETYYKLSRQTMKQRTFGQGHGDGHYIDLGASYDIDSLNLISLSASGSIIPFKANGHASTIRTDSAGNQLYAYSYRNKMGMNFKNFNTRLDYQHKTRRAGETLTASYMLATSRNKTTPRFTYYDMQDMPVEYNGYKNRNKSTFQEHTFQLDYVLPISKTSKVETGAKYIYRLSKNNTLMDYDGSTPDMLSRFNHTTHVAAAYAVYSFTSKRFTFRPGLRYEYTRLKGSYPDGSNPSFHRSLNDWVPSASLQFKFDDVNSLSLSYSTSISRPGITYLNPAVVSTPEARSFGNSHLKSSRNNQVQFTYSAITSKIVHQLIALYSFYNDGITNIQYEENGIQTLSYANAAKCRTSALIDYLQWMPSPSTTLSVNGLLQWTDMKSPSMNICNVGWHGSIGGNLSQKLWWKIRANLGLSTSFGKNATLYGVGANYHSDYLSLQRSFLNDMLTVSLFASCIFEPHHAYTVRTVRGNYTEYAHAVNKARQCGLTISWQFGKMKESVKRASHTIENNDVIGGVSSGANQKSLKK